MSREQFNVTLPADVADRARQDARRHRVSLGDVAAVALQDFFQSFSVAERAQFYAKIEKKRRGRPVSVA